MVTMTINEFKKYCKEKNPVRILFHSDDQDAGLIDKNCRVNLLFSSVQVYENPDVVFFKNDNNSLCFSRIEQIVVDSERIPIGDVIKIVCHGGCKTKKCFTLIAIS